eukprot:TRINITY_DN19405_c0_g1_i1.p2 TRINITY_DN19405_c0_g1~~TRINITY_DN19405_c0_g1_i1.p2  ORF type:complete len:312 (-),score=66.68 TRINITY_DN19405_c0_g1_i1:126-1010(-)
MGFVASSCSSFARSNPCGVARVLRHDRGREVTSDYELGGELGHGGYATVVRCSCRRSGEVRACKSILKARAHGADGALREADIHCLLRGDGDDRILRLLEVFEDASSVHLILELCGGGELFERQADVGVFAEAEAQELLRQMLRALEHLQRHRVLHRDLKLENWLLTAPAPSLDLRLCDLGLSVVLAPGEQASELVGSPYYVAPEVLKGCYDAQADLWSLGVILYMLLSGAPPFNGATPKDIFASIRRGSPDFAERTWDETSPAAAALILDLLAFEPADRPSPAAVLQGVWIEE